MDGMKDLQDVIIRFLIGGTVLAGVYIISIVVPWRSLSGVFAAFPAIMATAAGLTGWKQGSKTASDVAKGSISGMIGATACVLTTLLVLNIIHTWWLALILAILIWIAVSLLVHLLCRE
jgi:hypothetical protein